MTKVSKPALPSYDGTLSNKRCVSWTSSIILASSKRLAIFDYADHGCPLVAVRSGQLIAHLKKAYSYDLDDHQYYKWALHHPNAIAHQLPQSLALFIIKLDIFKLNTIYRPLPIYNLLQCFWSNLAIHIPYNNFFPKPYAIIPVNCVLPLWISTSAAKRNKSKSSGLVFQWIVPRNAPRCQSACPCQILPLTLWTVWLFFENLEISQVAGICKIIKLKMQWGQNHHFHCLDFFFIQPYQHANYHPYMRVPL